MSTSSRDNRLFGTMPKARRSPPGDPQGSVFFTGQGGRTVLPPLTSAFPTSRFPVPNTYTTPYTQPRSSPGRYELNPQALNYGTWPSGNTSPQLSNSYPSYETTERYYTTTAYSSRPTSPVPDSPGESRRLPPIPGTGWPPQTAYVATTPYPNNRTPTTAYAYPNYATNNPATSYSYSISPQDHQHQHHQHQHQHHHQQATLTASTNSAIYGGVETQRSEPRPASPYNRGTSSAPQANSTPTPAASSAASEEPTIKKKRKRADATQLKVLNDTYARTAFPSTEERLHLAKVLDMSPRSVQIWFQNKRQSMRQTSRQSSSTSSGAHQSFAVASSGDVLIDEMSHSHPYGGSMAEVPYLTPVPQDSSRTHSPHTSSPHQRIRAAEDVESRKWSRGY